MLENTIPQKNDFNEQTRMKVPEYDIYVCVHNIAEF